MTEREKVQNLHEILSKKRTAIQEQKTEIKLLQQANSVMRESTDKLRDQLTAERESLTPLVDYLIDGKIGSSDDVTVNNILTEIKQLREQLAAAKAANKALIGFAEWGWTIIANAHGGDWEKESKDWQEAAAKYRDQLHQEMRQPCTTTALDSPIKELAEELKLTTTQLATERHDAAATQQALVDALTQYMAAMDALYNHNAATRAAVVRHFGTLHPPEVVNLLAKVKECLSLLRYDNNGHITAWPNEKQFRDALAKVKPDEQEMIALHTAAAKLAGADGVIIKPTGERGPDGIFNAANGILQSPPKPTGEWTAAYVAGLCAKPFNNSVERYQLVADAHNAALDEAVDAAEQEILLLRQQLAAETWALALAQGKLAAAQARCGELVKMCNDHDFYPDSKIDTTALDAAITDAVKAENKRMMEFHQGAREIMERKAAAAQQPLVDALKESNQMLVACSESAQILKRVDKSGGWQKAEAGILDLIQRNTTALAKAQSYPLPEEMKL